MTRAFPLLFLALGLGSMGLTACARFGEVGKTPELSDAISGPEFQAMQANAYALPEYPTETGESLTRASLWSTAPSSLIGDRRASQIGDILTVAIEIDDKAEFQNSSGQSRSANEKVGIPSMMGLPQRLNKMMPEGASMDELAEAKSSSSYKGSGNISRREKLTLRIAATVIDKLPNGVLRIQGTQEVRVNYEVRELTVSGFVRPSDIGRRNEIAYDRIAGARISYGGRGNISQVQQPRLGQQIADIILPY